MGKNILLGEKIKSKYFVSVGNKGERLFDKGMVETEEIPKDFIDRMAEDKELKELKEAIVKLYDLKPGKIKPVLTEVLLPHIYVHEKGIAGRDRFECSVCGRKDFKTSGDAKFHLKSCKRG